MSANYTQGTGSKGAGIYSTGGAMTLTNCTLAGNYGAGSPGGLVVVLNGGLYLRNTIISGSTGADCSSGNMWANTHNLVEDGTCSAGGVAFRSGDPRLGALAPNGGSTQTHALLVGSPAVDGGDNAVCPATDQRGVWPAVAGRRRLRYRRL